MVQNTEFRQACEAWFKATLSLLCDQPVPVTQDLQVTFLPDGWRTQVGLKPDYNTLYRRHEEILLKVSEVDALANSIVKSPPPFASFDFIGITEQSGVDPDGLKKWLVGFYLYKFFMEYLGSNNTFTFIPAEFERIYEKLEYYLYNREPFTAHWLVSFSDLMLEMELLTLEDGIYLRQTTEAEKERIIKEGASFNPVLHALEVPKVYLEIRHSINKLTFPDQQAATDIAQAVVLALRLIKASPIGISLYRWEVPDQPFWLFQGLPFVNQMTSLMFHSSNFQHRSAIVGERYVLTQQDAIVLPKLFKKVKKASKDASLTTAITRFEDSYTRTKPQDKLIDYWTALEALFFLKDEFQDMGKSLALAASYYLGRTSSERSTIYHDLTRSHTLRSLYIHGERKPAKYSLDEMVPKTGNHLRRALRKRIEETG